MRDTKAYWLLVDLLGATRNEIAIDEMFLSVGAMSAEDVGYFPRVPRWINLATKYKLRTKLLWRCCRWIWLGGGNIVYFAIELVRYALIRSSKRKRSSISLTEPDGFVLALSTRVGDILELDKFDNMPNVWITMPWAPLLKLPGNAMRLNVLDLLSSEEFLVAFCLAIRFTYILNGRKTQSKWSLQSYTAFRWCLVRLAVDKLSGPLVMAEHFDRWAVLVDGSVSKNFEETSARCNNRVLTLVQHGALGGLAPAEGGRNNLLKLPRRLKVVSNLYVYNSSEEQHFRDLVLSHANDVINPIVSFFKPTIRLVGDMDCDKYRVLFVGHPLCETVHMEIYRNMKQRGGFEAYYKPHPLMPMSASLLEVGWIVILEPAEFPVVDFLISYPSTLVIEYENSGIPSAVHPLNMTFDSVVEYFEFIEEKFL